ncbi:F-box protein At5g07610-like [Arachis stenosperma]|uniref:F-box protein At5g07610-like n=1 Tax=Arachis stenosperma TaxID=217475 RepID=UPI0025AD4492|nr:F-box protein At5g07610-like [Arachis stenosperma]
MGGLISSSAQAIEGNDDLLTQILVRLPHKDAITFKLVSKRWRSLISSPYFRCCHATVKRRVSGLFLYHITNPVNYGFKFFSFDTSSSSSCFPEIPDLLSWQILQSCNGLMLVHKSKEMFIYNPTTADKKTLPWPFPWLLGSLFVYYALAFDPLRFFGYKLIYIFGVEFSKEVRYQIMIYSSESGVWNLCGSSFSTPFERMDFAHGIYFKDSVYWIGSRSKMTLRFDLKEECVKDDMPPLPAEPHHYYKYVLAPACGYMNLVGFGDSELCVSVFRLKEDYSSRWVLMHNVELQFTPLVISKNGSIRRPCSIIYLIEDDEDEMALLVQTQDKVSALRLKDNTYHHVFDLPKVRSTDLHYSFPIAVEWHRAFEYIETLASV